MFDQIEWVTTGGKPGKKEERYLSAKLEFFQLEWIAKESKIKISQRKAGRGPNYLSEADARDCLYPDSTDSSLRCSLQNLQPTKKINFLPLIWL